MTTIFADDSGAALVMMDLFLKKIDPEGTHLSAGSVTDAMALMEEHEADVLFLDIEMPGINGIIGAHYLEASYPKLNIIFVTGHPEYALDALKVYPSGFIEKPFDEDDIREALRHLRYPIEQAVKKPLKISCGERFTVMLNDSEFAFEHKLTMELFAYLVYKNGEVSSNAELIDVLYEGDFDKEEELRALFKDMRGCFENAGVNSIIVKRHGCTTLNNALYDIEGELSDIAVQYGWSTETLPRNE